MGQEDCVKKDVRKVRRMTRGGRRLLIGEMERDNSWDDAAEHELASLHPIIKGAMRKIFVTFEGIHVGS